MPNQKNYHFYTALVRQKLPPGRWLKDGESIKDGDLQCSPSGAATKTDGGGEVWPGDIRYYRPIKKMERRSRKYRYLKIGEKIRPTDEYRPVGTKSWIRCDRFSPGCDRVCHEDKGAYVFRRKVVDKKNR